MRGIAAQLRDWRARWPVFSAIAGLSLVCACDQGGSPGGSSAPTPEPRTAATPETKVDQPTPAPVVPTPPPTPAPTPTPLPQAYIPYRKLETAKLFSGIQVQSDVETKQGGIASVTRGVPENYALQLKLEVAVPSPVETLEQLEKLNPGLGKVLPGLKEMAPSAKVSPYFHGLYRGKVEDLQRKLSRLDLLLSTHNFYDCETILELEHPATKRKLLLAQAEMDVDADGSDSDRLIDVDGSSTFYQPFTSYKWPKRTDVPNSFLAGREDQLKKDEAELSKKGLSIERNRVLRTNIERLKREITELKRYSFLISRTDPFIVLPGFMFSERNSPHAPTVGDYGAVVYGEKIYPAILGDVGPSIKMGEASLRICQELRPNSNAYNRPVSDLKVTYLVFPGTAERPFGPPDLVKWREKVTALVGEIGGAGVEMHDWPDLIPKPSPSPTPEASPPASPTPSVSPSPSTSPGPSSSPSVAPTPSP